MLFPLRFRLYSTRRAGIAGPDGWQAGESDGAPDPGDRAAVADLCPAAGLWPEAGAIRAVARAAATEMHGGFPEVRKAFPMDLKRTPAPRPVPAEAAPEIARLTALWSGLRERYGCDGRFLFGRFTIADAMYAPVCVRFDSYRVPLDPVSQAYVEAVLAMPAMAEWRAAALAEPWEIAY